jgi:hypothetical protein
MEQLATYAELANVPFEVVYDAREVDSAIKRLSQDCDVIIIDTPGRSPASAELTERWRSLLDTIAPDEVHLVLPASLRADLAVDIGRAYAASRAHCGATHLLLSKLDEVPSERGVTDLALSLEMPTRWITDGQDVPADLKPGVPRLLHLQIQSHDRVRQRARVEVRQDRRHHRSCRHRRLGRVADPAVPPSTRRNRAKRVQHVRGPAELAGGGAEHHELSLRREVHAGRERGDDVRGGVRPGVCRVCSRHVQGAGGRAGVYHMRAEPVVCRGNDNLLLRARVHRAGRGAVR